MKYVREHINEKFTQESDPIKDMNMGDPEKALFPLLKKELEPFKINIWWRELGEGQWEIEISPNYDVMDEYYNSFEYINLYYFLNDDVARQYAEYYFEDVEEDEGDYFKSGFNLTSEDESYIIDPTSDYKKIARALIKINYGARSEIKTKIQKLQDSIDLYKKILNKR